MTDSAFKKRDKGEVSVDDEGFHGSLFSGTVVKSPTKKSKKVVVECDTLVSEKDETKALSDCVDLVKVRPVPPRESDRTFKVSKEETLVANHEKVIEELFSKGSQVEVSSDDDGFQGAWFDATVISVLGNGKYLIEYKELRTDDDSEFLKEEVDASHIRPIPPKMEVVDRFSLYEEIDALHNDAWWVGVISKVLVNSMYLVYFKESNEELKFGHDQLRPHQDWMNGKWITTNKVWNLSK